MFIKYFIIALLLVNSLKSFSGDDFPNPVEISPSNIDTTTDIQVGLTISPCRNISEDFFIQVDGGNIVFIYSSVGTSPCPPGSILFSYNIGTLPEGQYSIAAFETYGFELPDDPLDPSVILTQLGTPVSFGVSTPRTVPTLNLNGIIVMLCIMMMFAFFAAKTRGV